jgi:lipid-A-disaccharide synthase
MVNLVAERQIVPELMQNQMTPENIASAAEDLLAGSGRAARMRDDLAKVRAALISEGDPFRRAADLIAESCGIRQAGTVSVGAIRETMN